MGPLLLDDLDLGIQEVELEPDTSGDIPCEDATACAARANTWLRWLTRWIPRTSGLG